MAIGWPSTIEALRHTCLTRGPFRSIRCRLAWSFVAAIVAETVGSVDAAGVDAVEVDVGVSVRSFFRSRKRDVSSGSAGVTVDDDELDFFET